MTHAILLGVAISMQEQNASAAAGKTSPSRIMLVLGDSLSEGFRLPAQNAWPMLIAQRLHRIDPAFRVINASASGGTTAGGLARLPSHLRNRIDIFVLELGINDAFRGLPIDQIRANLQTIIESVRERNPNVSIVILGMQFPVTTDDAYVNAFGRMFGELAQQNQAALVPYLLAGVAGNPALNLDDWIHPNAAGQRVLAETVWQVLEPVARKVAANR